MGPPSHDDVAARLVGAGELLDDVDAILQSDDGAWTVRFDRADVAVDLDAASGTLGLLALVGFVPADRQAAVHAALLQYNHLRRDTGVWMSLTAEGAVAQSAVVRVDDASPHDLAALLRGFVDKVRAWRDFAAEGAAPPAPTVGDGTFLLKA